MVTWLLLASMSPLHPALPVSFIPSSQSPFKPGEFVIESKPGEKLGIVLCTDDRTPHLALEAIEKNAAAFQVVDLVKQSGGANISFDSAGKKSPTTYSDSVSGLTKDGSLALITLVDGYDPMPTAANSKPHLAFHFAKPGTELFFEGPKSAFVQSLGPQTAPFIDVKMVFQVEQFGAMIEPKGGATAKVDDITLSVATMSTPPTDGRSHLVVSQNGIAGAGFTFVTPVFDWDAIRAAKLNLTPENTDFKASMIRPNGRPTPGLFRQDVSSIVPLQYWKGILVIRHAEVQGYITHLPTSPK